MKKKRKVTVKKRTEQGYEECRQGGGQEEGWLRWLKEARAIIATGYK